MGNKQWHKKEMVLLLGIQRGDYAIKKHKKKEKKRLMHHYCMAWHIGNKNVSENTKRKIRIRKWKQGLFQALDKIIEYMYKSNVTSSKLFATIITSVHQNLRKIIG